MTGINPPREIPEGLQASCEYAISQEVYDHFIAAFQDLNPLHVDDKVARDSGFPEKLTHGMILNGFISHFVGCHCPAGLVLLHSVNTQLKSPCHVGDAIRIDGTVIQVSAAVGVAVMDLILTNTTRDRIAARCKVQVGLLQ